MKYVKMFLPLIFFYIIITVLFSKSEIIGDESRYILWARNLINGSFLNKANIDLTNGPGYPIVLLPFVITNITSIIPKLLNIIFVICGLIYFYKSVSFFVEKRKAIIISYILGLFPLPILSLLRLYTEALAFFLVCGFIFHLLYYLKSSSDWKQLLISSFYLGYLALTRTIFGYVIATSIIVLLVLYFYKRQKMIKKSIYVLIMSMVFCLPYLTYTYCMTGRIFFWSSTGDVLYWLSTPYENEVGDWIERDVIFKSKEINAEHKIFYNKIKSLNSIDQYDMYVAKAIDNIQKHPIKFFRNYVANIGRLIFNYPYTYYVYYSEIHSAQKINTFLYIVPHMILVLLFIFSLYASFISRNLIPTELIILMIIGFIYLIGSTFASAVIRYFILFLPFIFLWLTYVYTHFIKISIVKPISR